MDKIFVNIKYGCGKISYGDCFFMTLYFKNKKFLEFMKGIYHHKINDYYEVEFTVDKKYTDWDYGPKFSFGDLIDLHKNSTKQMMMVGNKEKYLDVLCKLMIKFGDEIEWVDSGFLEKLNGAFN